MEAPTLFFNGIPQRVSSHLKWRDLNIWQIEAQGRYVTCDNIYLRANADYGWITSGKNTDTDNVRFDGSNGYDNGSDFYNGGGNDFQFARSHSKVKGHVYDVELAVGYQFKLCDDNFSIAPLVGYSWHGQHLKDRHLRQSFFYSDDFTDGGYVTGARSRSSDSYPSIIPLKARALKAIIPMEEIIAHYHTRWDGVFIGFDFDYRFGCCCEWDLFGGYEFHFAQYHAKGHWNLRDDLFDGFRHHAKDAYGNTFDIGIQWDFCECWTLALKGEFQWWWADHGRDRALVAEARVGDVKTDCFLSIPLRDIKWQSAAVSVDLGMVF